MNRKWLFGIGAGVLVAAALILVGAGAYRAGERRANDVEVLRDGGETVRTVIVDDWHRGGGFFPGFFLFPLIIIGIVLLVASRRRAWCGPRPYGYGPHESLDDWHRRAHGDVPPPAPPSPPTPGES